MTKWRIVFHWPGGTYTPSDYEKSRYHFLIDGDANVIEGDLPPEVNQTVNGRLPHNYVQHSGGFNSNCIGIAVCGMKGATEVPFRTGSWPIKMPQINAACELAAELSDTYRIPATRDRMLLHSEVRPRFGRGKYKWDVNTWPGITGVGDPEVIGDMWRAKVQGFIDADKAPVPLNLWRYRWDRWWDRWAA